jgi:hypothetical protein
LRERLRLRRHVFERINSGSSLQTDPFGRFLFGQRGLDSLKSCCVANPLAPGYPLIGRIGQHFRNNRLNVGVAPLRTGVEACATELRRFGCDSQGKPHQRRSSDLDFRDVWVDGACSGGHNIEPW